MSRESGGAGEGSSASRRYVGEGGNGSWCAGLANTVQDGIYRLDSERYITAVNSALVEMTGYSQQELLGEHVSVLFGGEAFARSELATRRLLSGDERDVQTVGVAVTTADGEELPCTLRVGWTADENTGATVGVLRKPAQYEGETDEQPGQPPEPASESAEYWEQYQQFEQMIDAVEDNAIFMLDPHGTVVTWNEGAHRLIGYDRADILGEHFSTFYGQSERDDGVPDQNLAEAAANGRVEDEGWRVREDGSRFWVNVVISAIRDEAGDLQGFTKITRDMTERREYERQLKRERNLTQRVLDVAPVAISVVDSDGEIVRANQRMCALMDIDPNDGTAEVGAVDVYDADGESLPTEQRPCMQVFETGEPATDEQIRIETDDGSRWLSVNTVPIDDDGEVSQVVVAAEDVTQLKEQGRQLEAERNALASELNEVFERITGAFFGLDRDWRFTYVNEQAETLLGKSEATLLGDRIWDEFPDAVGSTFQEQYERALERQEPVSFEAYCEGIESWFAVDAYPSESGLSVYFQDISERKEQEAAVRRERDRARTILELAGSLMVIIDPDGTIVYINRRGCEVLGYEKAELLGENWFDTCIPARNSETVRAVFEEVISGEQEQRSRVGKVVTAAGDERTIKWNNTILGGRGQTTRTLSAGTDITERIRREERLQRYSDYLNEFYHISTRSDTDFDEKVEQLLSAGCEFLDFDIGILSEIDGNDYHIRQVHDDTGGITVGDSYSLGDTYCELTIQQTQPLGFESAADADLVTHPCYQEFGLQSYLGVAVRVDGELYGTLSFSSPDTRDREISELDRTFLTLLSQWVSYELERREYERELEQSKHRYQTLVDNFPNGAVALFDEEFRYLIVGGQGLRKYGLEAADLEGNRLQDCVPEPLVEAIEPHYRAAIEGETSTFEIEYANHIRQFYTLPVRDSEGTVIAGMAMSQDVTEERERQRELEEYRRWTQTLMANFPNGAVAIVDDDLRYVSFGGTPEGDADVTREDLEGEDIREVLPQSIAEVVVPQYEAALAGEASEFEATIDDQVYQFYFTPVRDDDGEVFAAAAISQDITQRKEREQELQTRVCQQRVVTQLGQQALAEDDLDALFDEAVELVAETVGTDYCKVLELLPDGEELLLRSGVGWRDGLVGTATVPADRESQAGYTLISEAPVLVPDMDAETRFSGPELLTSHDVESGMSVVIGPPENPWGILGTHDTEKEEFTEQDVNFVQSVANILTTAIDRVEHEQQIERQRERLAALNNLNGIIREIIQVLIQQSTRENIEQLVCQRLADSDSYEFAWIGEIDSSTDEVVLRTEAGVDEYLDDVTITVDGGQNSRGPTGQAFKTGEIQVCQDVRRDPAYEQWRDRALDYGYRSLVSVPITYENTMYGVLNIYADRPDAFSGEERAVIGQLGEVMGHAINAIERKRLLMSDEVIEVEFRIRNVFDELGLDGSPRGRFTIDQMIPTGQGYLAYGTVSEDGVETLELLVDQLSTWDSVSFISDGFDERRFELRLSDPPSLSIVAGHGGHIPSATFEDGDYWMTAELPPDAPVREVVDDVKAAYPAAEVLAQRRTATDRETRPSQLLNLETILTERQYATVKAAYSAGFFEWPRESTGEEVAEALDISAPTFHQHLRGAEQRIMATLLDS